MDEEELETRFEDLDKRLRRLEDIVGYEEKKNLPKRKSLKEFFLEKKPSSYHEKLVVLGYYLEHFREMPSFNVKDIVAAFRRAKERPPSNPNDTANTTVDKGWLMEQGEKDGLKAWCLTNTGEGVVKNGF